MVNKYSLSDQEWTKVEGGYEARSVFKMIPASRVFQPGKDYRVQMEGRTYEGRFNAYVYRKETMDSALVRVYIELQISEGTLVVPEDGIVTNKEI